MSSGHGIAASDVVEEVIPADRGIPGEAARYRFPAEHTRR
jgi:hypothetical protein